MSRIPIRLRLTGAFALALLLVLAIVAVFVHARMSEQLDETIDNNLRARSDDLASAVKSSGPRPIDAAARVADPEESFAQVLYADGRLAGGPGPPLLSPAEAREATGDTITRERSAPELEGRGRLLARGVTGPDGRPMVVVVAASLDDRDEELNELLTSFALAGGLAILLASALGYGLARRALAPVDAMRRRADTVSLGHGEERLPLPEANDEIRRLGETLNQMLARLEESFERERRFVADASHDLRTPLAVVKTELEAALRSGDAADQRESIVAALAEVDHLAQLAEDLLLIARAADGQLPVRPEAVDLHDLLEATRERFGDRAREEQRTIEVDAPAELTAQLDPLRLRQAIGNVVDNALRHGKGTVSLTARAHDDEVTVAVTDEGPGFSPELAAHAFERFTRGDESRARDGSGLGLAIVKAVAEAHGGSAAIDGATVTLTFPRGSHRDLSVPREPAVRSTDGG